jgi:L-methionine (R)-S-oxide reductase
MYHSLGSPLSSVNWAGFYVVDRKDHGQLILGPFHGRVACQTIRIGKGVCGTAAGEGRTLLLEDVSTFPGHIACDGESKSEIVVPIKVGEKVCYSGLRERELLTQLDLKVVGVIDVDCADLQGFDSIDQEGLEQLAQILGGCCDWEDLV